jgi:hypothetical protein
VVDPAKSTIHFEVVLTNMDRTTEVLRDAKEVVGAAFRFGSTTRRNWTPANQRSRWTPRLERRGGLTFVPDLEHQWEPMPDTWQEC